MAHPAGPSRPSRPLAPARPGATAAPLPPPRGPDREGALMWRWRGPLDRPFGRIDRRHDGPVRLVLLTYRERPSVDPGTRRSPRRRRQSWLANLWANLAR